MFDRGIFANEEQILGRIGNNKTFLLTKCWPSFCSVVVPFVLTLMENVRKSDPLPLSQVYETKYQVMELFLFLRICQMKNFPAYFKIFLSGQFKKQILWIVWSLLVQQCTHLINFYSYKLGSLFYFSGSFLCLWLCFLNESKNNVKLLITFLLQNFRDYPVLPSS